MVSRRPRSQLAVGTSASAGAVILLAAAFVGLSLRPDSGPAGGPVAPAPSASETEAPLATASPRATLGPTPTDRPTPRPTPEVTSPPTPSATPMPTPVPATPVPATPVPPPPPHGHGALPDCAYTDVLTPHHQLHEWQITLLDTIYQLPASYAPGDLVDSGAAGLNGGYLVRAVMLDDLRAMAADARSAGTPIQIVSGYRGFEQQRATFDYWVGVGGYEQALRTSARAGHSEHQLGTAIDVTSEGGLAPWEYADWAATPAGAWMAANAWRYGFVMSYPSGATNLSCYAYEPWHYRYVGRELAAQVAGGGRVLRQVLWEIQ